MAKPQDAEREMVYRRRAARWATRVHQPSLKPPFVVKSPSRTSVALVHMLSESHQLPFAIPPPPTPSQPVSPPSCVNPAPPPPPLPWKVCRSPMTTADIIEVTCTASPTTGKAVAAPRKPPPSIPSKGAAATGSRNSSSSNGGAGTRAKLAPRDTGGGGGGGGWIGSTKLARLELELREMRKKTPGAKAVVFSQVPSVVVFVLFWDG